MFFFLEIYHQSAMLIEEKSRTISKRFNFFKSSILHCGKSVLIITCWKKSMMEYYKVWSIKKLIFSKKKKRAYCTGQCLMKEAFWKLTQPAPSNRVKSEFRSQINPPPSCQRTGSSALRRTLTARKYRKVRS